MAELHYGELCTDAAMWKWPNDDRIFLVPGDLLLHTNLMPLVRDVVAYLSTCYRIQKPADRIISTSLTELALAAELSKNERNLQRIWIAIALARAFTVINHPTIIELTKTGKLKAIQKNIFGLIDWASYEHITDGKKVPKKRAKAQVQLSQHYTTMLNLIPPAPLPVAALEAANRAAWRLQVPTKNLAYYLAAQVPRRKVRLKLKTVAQICGFASGRADQLREAIEHTLTILNPIMVQNFSSSPSIVEIEIAGSINL